MYHHAFTPRTRLLCLIVCFSMLAHPTFFALATANVESGARKTVSTTPPPPPPSRPAHSAVGQSDGARTGRLLARFRRDRSKAEVDSLVVSYSLKNEGALRGDSGLFRLSLLPGQTLDAVVAALQSDPSVEFVEPDYRISADQARPDDPRFREQWALGGVRGRGAGANAAAAWSKTTGSPETVVAVIDSGVDFTHTDLRDNRWTKDEKAAGGGDGYDGDLHGWDWVSGSPEVRDESGHGTAVAGLIAATGNNREGIAGVLWRASLMSLRVLDRENQGYVSDAVEAIDYAVSHGAHVINCSWGLDEPSVALKQALKRAIMHNVTVVCSAGNGARDIEQTPRYPAAYDLPFLISVAATDREDNLTAASDWGEKYVAVGAPGAELLTTKIGGGYETFSGTSAATAVVSGVAGLVRTLRPHLSSARMQQMLLGGARKVTTLEGKVMSSGVIDAAGALNAFSLLQPGEGLSPEETGAGDGAGDHVGEGVKAAGARSLLEAGSAAVATAAKATEALDLPDLNEARRPAERGAHAIPPIPSSRRRCPPHNRRCNDERDAGAQPSPTPGPGRRAALGSSSAGSVATLAKQTFLMLVTAAFNGGRPMLDVPLSDYYGSSDYAVSDNAPTLALAPNAASDAAPPLSPESSAAPEPAPLVAAPAVPFQSQGNPQPFVTNMALGALRSDSPGWTGFQMTTGAQPLTLTSLGRLCSSGNSLLHELRVIRVSDNVLLATTSVSMSGCTQNQFRYEDLPTPVTLTANTAYVVVSYEAGGDTFHDWTNSWLTTTTDATINGAIYTINGGQTWSLATGNGNSYVPVDFKYTPGLPSTNFVTGMTNGAMRADSPGWTGFQMTTASQPVTVTSLGRLCLPNNSLSHDLKIVRLSDNTAVATATVSMSGCTVNQFKYAQLASPVTLAANTAYVVVSYEVGGDLFYDWTGQWLTTTSVAMLNGAIYTINGGQTWSLATGSGNSYVPVDFKYQTSEQALGTGLTAKYYDNLDFTSYKMTRVDPTINFDWGNGAPSAAMGADQFSVRWMGLILPRYSQTYTFYTTTDDGVRLWIDGQLVIDKWLDQAPTTWSGQVALQAGRAYDIRMEFYDNFGGASAKLEWQSTSQTREVVPQSRLYPCWKSIDQFVTELYQSALARQPSQTELQDWTDRLARAQGETQLLEQARFLGFAVFDLSPSSAYTARNRSDGDFVADLYRGFLQRDPDQAGWDYWKSKVPTDGRGNVREAFAQSGEFYEKVKRLCGTSVAADVNNGIGYNFASARLDPSNRTGVDGVDPLSGNFNWSVPLLNLPGRAGLDLGLTLSYNSLVWTKDATGITFDADEGFPSPGFRLGFPVIQPKFFNPSTQKNAYLMLTPAGGRVELRQVGTSTTYESADSSYLQLTEGLPLTLLLTDGTKLSFSLLNGSYRCTSLKDRNGNYITVNYDQNGLLTTIVDTLGRTVSFGYDSFQNPISITQLWTRETISGPVNEQPHIWATFGYTNVTLQPSFSNLAVIGDQSGTVIPALTQVGLADGSYFKFSYNQWGQVWKVTHYAGDSINAQGQPNDSHALSYTRLNLPGSDLAGATAQSDCPRFTEKRMWIENGVMNQSAEVTTTYSAWSPGMAECDITPPDPTPTDASDNVVFKEFYATSGWQKGLTTSAQVWVNGVQRKWTNFTWTQDDTNAGYQINPRVTDTTVNDSENHHRRTSTTYTTFALPSGASCSLPQDVTDYMADTTTPLRTMRTEYNLSSEYTTRRIIGLPSFLYLYDGTVTASHLRSKTGFIYDDSTMTNYLQGLPFAATQHDATNYGTGLRWRGNLNRVRRYELNTQTWAETGAYTEAQTGYGITGTSALMTDELGHTTTFSYADSFYQGVNRSSPALQTFAYPTSATIQEQNPPQTITSSSQYNYDTGLLTQTTDAKNAITKTLYDSAGRVERITRRDGVNGVDKGYTRWVYPSSMKLLQTYVLTDAAKPEAYSAQVLDGVGRVRATAADHPGSLGGYSGQLIDYDAAGRAVRRSNPTETNASGISWLAKGDDDPANGGAGWVYTNQAYDWKDRPTITTNTSDGTSRTIVYGSCGCAGGTVVTMTDEVGRKQRTTSDVLGREVKLEDLNPDDSVYRTTTTSYNVRDQVTQAVTQIGSSGTAQTTSTEYDGYGRVWKNFFPQATGPIVLEYFADDSLHIRTDARGATTTYSYNNRGLTTGVTYALATDVWSAGYGYDAVGNRTSMTDGMGTVSYVYDTMSRLTSETRTFSEIGRSFTTTYDYNLADELTLVHDHFGNSVTYTRDQTGRVTDIPGYSTAIKYRAWGALKQQSLANGRTVSLTYDARMRMSQFNVPGVTGWQYSYYGDGRLQFASNLQQQGTRDERLDRKLAYDVVGRLSLGTSGSDARGESGSNTGPYRQTFSHDVWDHMTFRDNLRGNIYNSYSASYVNNRNQNTGWQYDANGTLTRTQEGSSTTQYTYNCANHMTSAVMTTSTSTTNILYGYDGDSGRVKKVETNVPTTYYVRASALKGQVLDEVDSSGTKLRGYVYQEGNLIAKQEGAQTQWDVRDPANYSNWVLNSSGGVVSHVELDPLGTVVDPNNTSYSQNPIGFYGSASLQGSYCRVNNLGVSVPCSLADMLNSHGFNQTVTVNGEEMPLAMAQGMADIGWINPNDIIFGNPWDLANVLPRMTFRQSAPAPPSTVNANTPSAPPPSGESPSPLGRNFFFNWGAFSAGYLWVSGYGASRSEVSMPGAFIQLPYVAPASDPTGKMTSAMWSVFSSAFDDAVKAAIKCGNTLNELAGNSSANPRRVLEEMMRNNRFQYDPQNAANRDKTTSDGLGKAAAQSTVGNAKSPIRIFDRFFTSYQLVGTGGYKLSDLQQRTLTILHELAHVLGATHPTDADEQKLNQRIIRDCL